MEPKLFFWLSRGKILECSPYRRACWAQVDFKGVGLDYPRLDIIRSVVRCFAGGAEDTSEVGSAEARGEVEEDSKTGTEGVDGVKEIRTRL